MPDKSTEHDHGHPWGDFLHYRARVLRWLRDEMKESPEEICRTLSMEPGQVRLILMTVDEQPAAYGFAPPPFEPGDRVRVRKEK